MMRSVHPSFHHFLIYMCACVCLFSLFIRFHLFFVNVFFFLLFWFVNFRTHINFWFFVFSFAFAFSFYSVLSLLYSCLLFLMLDIFIVHPFDCGTNQCYIFLIFNHVFLFFSISTSTSTSIFFFFSSFYFLFFSFPVGIFPIFISFGKFQLSYLYYIIYQ